MTITAQPDTENDSQTEDTQSEPASRYPSLGISPQTDLHARIDTPRKTHQRPTGQYKTTVTRLRIMYNPDDPMAVSTVREFLSRNGDSVELVQHAHHAYSYRNCPDSWVQLNFRV